MTGNVAASVRARLSNKARQDGRPFQEVLQYYGLERFLYDPAPRLRMYPRETVVAEKFEAMVYLGSLNSRMKDFFDIWLLARQFDFVGIDLARAIGKTFKHRGTDLNPEPEALTAAFTASENTEKQWAGFIRRSRLEDAPARLEEIREPLRQFLLPVAVALTEDRDFAAQWTAPGPWRAAEDANR